MGISEYRTKAGRKYKAILYIGGQVVASQRGFDKKADAKKWLADEETRITKPKKEKPIGLGFVDCAEAYLSDMEVRKRPNTFGYKQTLTKRLITHMRGDFEIEALSPDDIDSFLKARIEAVSAKAANRDIVECKALWNWLIKKNKIQTNPWRAIDPFPEEQFQRYVPPADDVSAVRAVAQGQERDFVDVLFYTGARLGEACGLTWADIDFNRQTITLWTRKRKGGGRQPRTMGMVKPLAMLLKSRFDQRDPESNHVFTDPSTGKPLHKNTRWCITLMDNLCERAEVKRFTAHCIRHFVATRLKDSRQATPFQIQNFLGHQNLSTTETYLHELDVDRGVADLLDDSENSISDKIEPQIEPQGTLQ